MADGLKSIRGRNVKRIDVLQRDEARRTAVNIAKLPELLRRQPKAD